MDETKVALRAVQASTIKSLSEKLEVAMEAAQISISNQSLAAEVPAKSLFFQKGAIVERFIANMNQAYDSLTGNNDKHLNVLDYANLSLVGEEDLEALIAMEGMISHARNSDIREYLRFTTRLDTMLYGITVDESNNPMDPEQIGEAFKEAVRPLGLRSKELLISYRSFNTRVFHELDSVLELANQILIEHGVLPNLDLAARRKKEQRAKRAIARERSLPDERAFSSREAEAVGISTPQLFSMMQGLMHGSIPSSSSPANSQELGHNIFPSAMENPQSRASSSVPSGGFHQGMVVSGQRVEMIEQDKLFDLLKDLKSVLSSKIETRKDGTENGHSALVDVNKSLGELLKEDSPEGKLQAVDSVSADVISLITMLYEVIWQDETVPIPVKELLGRTQIAVLTVALKDSSFFDSSSHPVRQLINELATAGISWTEFDKLEQDPVYQKMLDIVGRFIGVDELDVEMVKGLLEEFQDFKREQSEVELELEKRLTDTDERQRRIEDIEVYGRQKIIERVLDDSVPSEVVEFLETKFHKFVTQVLLREGPGGVSWKPVMNTIDVLLWTVQTIRNDGDIERFVKVNPRLMVNLGKALSVAEYEESEIDDALKKLKKVQESSFKGLLAARKAETAIHELTGNDKLVIPQAPVDLAVDDEHLVEVGKYQIGIWLEFKTQGDRTVRCTLAAKIATIDKYVFINSQGVKVIEKTKMGLAKELKAGTVRVISEGPLIERAMETVIGNLRNSGTEEKQADSESLTA